MGDSVRSAIALQGNASYLEGFFSLGKKMYAKNRTHGRRMVGRHVNMFGKPNTRVLEMGLLRMDA